MGSILIPNVKFKVYSIYSLAQDIEIAISEKVYANINQRLL